MNNLNALQEVLTNLKDITNSIITNSVELFNTILIDTDELYEKFRQKTRPDITDDQIDRYFNAVIGEYISDAKTVKGEIDQFVRNMLDSVPQNEETFMYQVWSGDVYDCRKTDALVELYEELAQQENDFTLDVVFGKAVEHFGETEGGEKVEGGVE